jgi:hypothetical protein
MTRPDLPIPFARGFFDAYLVDHYLQKQYTLFNIIRGLPTLKTAVLEGLDGVRDEDYLKSLRVEIRSTYFQAIETLFELIFSLEPRDGIIDNENIWYYLSTSKGPANYETIEAIAKGETAFLDWSVAAGGDIQVPFVQYLFYFAITDEKAQPAILASLEPIRHILVALARDFVDRDEYNAFKHALRLMTIAQSFDVVNRSTGEPLVHRDLSNSLTYLKREKDGTITLRTKPLDTARDIRMTTLCSALISNLVRSRSLFFKRGPGEKFIMFTAEALASAGKTDFNWSDFRISFRAIRDEDASEQ